MTLEQIAEMLEKTNLPVAYRKWAEGQVPELPYIIYYADRTDNFKADNRVYHKIQDVSIELYTNTKNTREENKIEALLDANKLEWDAYEQDIESENMFEVLYEISL
ncbi:hypothetical protein [Enterococcus avium]|uniref:hypothetical protein n=1 Tax=Enterococcus avium TaxID=33945 RepID=UPI000C9CC78F|nr:hypothetical protein [Enterococcus avium]PNE45693.1 hypothetical protein AUF14_04680 [Enterococcus avium]DAL80731.1 MAG TPA: tail completion protein [Caudoviricetes sp.]